MLFCVLYVSGLRLYSKMMHKSVNWNLWSSTLMLSHFSPKSKIPKFIRERQDLQPCTTTTLGYLRRTKGTKCRTCLSSSRVNLTIRPSDLIAWPQVRHQAALKKASSLQHILNLNLTHQKAEFQHLSHQMLRLLVKKLLPLFTTLSMTWLRSSRSAGSSFIHLNSQITSQSRKKTLK